MSHFAKIAAHRDYRMIKSTNECISRLGGTMVHCHNFTKHHSRSSGFCAKSNKSLQKAFQGNWETEAARPTISGLLWRVIYK